MRAPSGDGMGVSSNADDNSASEMNCGPVGKGASSVELDIDGVWPVSDDNSTMVS